MNKKTIILLLAVVSATILSAQTTEKTIGLRFGTGGEISYQHPISDINRLEFDLGLRPQSIGLTGIYHWVNDLSDWTDGMYWYYGPGATVGIAETTNINKLMLGVTGQVGLEYRFEFPLQLSIDYRPSFYLIKPAGSGGSYDDICLSARYRF
jgi:hypothetical protein